MIPKKLIDGVIAVTFPEVLGKFDELEIHPCQQDDEGNVSVCDPEQAHFWTLYYHLTDGGLDCVADFYTKEDAESLRKFLYSFARYNNLQL